MQLKTTEQDIIRQLLVTNPYIANKKGSAKAIKMFLNILGFTCCIMSNDNPTLQICVDHADPEALLKSVEFENSTGNTLTKSMKFSIPVSSLAKEPISSKAATPVEVSATITASINSTDLDFPYITFNVTYSNNNVKATDVRLSVFNELLTTQAISDVLMSQYIDERSNNNTYDVILTNVEDYNIPKTTREALAAQINEIMPINMNIKADNIVGFNRGVIVSTT